MHKGILWSVDSLLPKGGCSFASFAVMSSIVFCLFSFVPLSRHKTCLNCSSRYMIFFFLLVVFTATLHQACCYALHLKSCVVDKSVVLFVILSIIVLYEFLCKHCFISSDCCIARCICLFHTKIFAKEALLFDFPLTPPSFFFFFVGFAMPDLGYAALDALFYLFGNWQSRMIRLAALCEL